MPRLTSDELMRRYGHLLRVGCVHKKKARDHLGWSYPERCDNCKNEFKVGETFHDVELPEIGITLEVCRDYAACERRRKEQAE